MSLRYQGGFLTESYFPLKVPNAPTIGTATAGNAQVSITFTAPSNVGGGAITSYIAVAKDSSSGAVFTATGSSSPVVVTGLTNGNTYTVKVAATNAYGTGPESAASGSFTPSASYPSTVEYLVVAGGGGGGGWQGGGGGAGGYRTATGLAVSAGTPLTVTVGAGGAGQPSGTNNAYSNGSNSVFDSITSTGGGKGGNFTAAGLAPSTGGSGGGGTYPTAGNGAAGTAGQGYAGGNGTTSSPYPAGGGGGSGSAGGNYSGSTGGSGGSGTASSISGSSVTYAGGGGGGGGDSSAIGGNGGSGGGGAGGSNSAGTSGTANTGGGGGGAGSTGTSGVDHLGGGTGGSGVVIIRYSDSDSAASSTTGSPTITVAGGYRVYKWTGSGSITF